MVHTRWQIPIPSCDAYAYSNTSTKGYSNATASPNTAPGIETFNQPCAIGTIFSATVGRMFQYRSAFRRVTALR